MFSLILKEKDFYQSENLKNMGIIGKLYRFRELIKNK